MPTTNTWDLELETKPDFSRAMERVNAWYNQALIDRVPIRFTAHNSEYSTPKNMKDRKWADLKSRWFDVEFQVAYFTHSLKGQKFLAETFPVFWPNLGPEVYSAFYGAELQYQEVTSYSIPIVEDWADLDKLKLDMKNEYFQTLEKMTLAALEQCKNQYMVGYSDLHPGIDCVAAWRDPQQLCMDLLMEPDQVKKALKLADDDYNFVFDHFDDMIKKEKQLSVTWLGIPSFGKMHIPSSDFAALISEEHFDEFILPSFADQCKHMDHNIFHVDGKGVARNLEKILEIPNLHAIQWVQGESKDRPILQWIPLIKRCQEKGKSVVLDLAVDELDEFISRMDPKGLYLCISADPGIQEDIIKRVEKW